MEDHLTADITPVTALLRSNPPLPLTLVSTLAALRKASEDYGSYVNYLGDSDVSHSPVGRDIEMIEGLAFGPVADYCESRFERGTDVRGEIVAGFLVHVAEMRRRPGFLIDQWTTQIRGAARCALLVSGNGGVGGRCDRLTAAAWALWKECAEQNPLNPGRERTNGYWDRQLAESGAENDIRNAMASASGKPSPYFRKWDQLLADARLNRDDDGTVSADEAAEISRVSKMTVTRWAESDPALGVKVGGRWRISRAALASRLMRA